MGGSDTLDDPGRRNFLVKVTTAVGGAGVAAACIPFIASMNPSTDMVAKATTEFDLSGMNPGDMLTIPWQGKPVFILRRSQEEISLKFVLIFLNGSSKWVRVILWMIPDDVIF